MLVTYSWEVPSLNQSQCTVVGIVTRVQAGWFRVWRGKRFFFFLSLKTYRPGLGAHPASYLMGTVVVKWLGCDVDQLPPSRADSICTALYSFMVWTGTTLLFLTSLNLGQDTCDPDWSSFFLPSSPRQMSSSYFRVAVGAFFYVTILPFNTVL